MECEEARPQLIRYADNDLLPGARMAVREHLAHCYYCHEELQDLEGLLDRCHALLRHPSPRNRFDDLRPHLRPPVAPANVTPFRVRHALVKLGSVAAAAMFLAVLTWLTAPAVQAAYDLSLMAEAYRAQTTQEITETELGSDSTPMAWRRALWLRALAEREKAQKPEADEAQPQEAAIPGPQTPMSWRGEDATDGQRAKAAGEPQDGHRPA
ncbi:MAG: hypothetical protein GWP08_14570 [Nitrospiraceae bacterium]|nr:hypothetical protein [Nitrospiraceae bacterium]